jgi:hypothetical protein
MHSLIKTVLPVIPNEHSLIETEVTTKSKVLGKYKVFKKKVKMFAKDIYPDNFWEQKALSVNEIVYELRRKGFLASYSNVRNALKDQACSSRFVNKKGWSYCRYFICPEELL